MKKKKSRLISDRQYLQQVLRFISLSLDDWSRESPGEEFLWALNRYVTGLWGLVSKPDRLVFVKTITEKGFRKAVQRTDFRDQLLTLQAQLRRFFADLMEGVIKDMSIRREIETTLEVTSDGVLHVDIRRTEPSFSVMYEFYGPFKLLNGKCLDKVIKTCPVCGCYFARLTAKEKDYCSHRCAVRDRARQRRKENPDMARRIQNIQTYFSLIKKQHGLTEREICSRLRVYIKKRDYKHEEIPGYIGKFLDKNKPKKGE